MRVNLASIFQNVVCIFLLHGRWASQRQGFCTLHDLGNLAQQSLWFNKYGWVGQGILSKRGEWVK